MKKLIILVLILSFAICANAVNISKEGRLNTFVKPTSDGGWGLPAWIISQMTENRAYTHQEIYATIQDSTTVLDASVKALSQKDIHDITEWMLDRGTFIVSGDTISIIRAEDDEITYNPDEIIEY